VEGTRCGLEKTLQEKDSALDCMYAEISALQKELECLKIVSNLCPSEEVTRKRH
jgi:hypothetical protein